MTGEMNNFGERLDGEKRVERDLLRNLGESGQDVSARQVASSGPKMRYDDIRHIATSRL
jgi:hypothetical protein